MSNWVMNVPVISTVHLKPETASLLEMGDASGYCVHSFEEGFLIYIGDSSEADENTFVEEDLINIAKIARIMGSNGWVRLDPAGTEVDTIRYDWN